MYAVAVILVGWLVLAAKELGRFRSANWNNLAAAGMTDKETMVKVQEQVHAQYYNGEKRRLTYPRITFFKQLAWICGDALAVWTLYSARLFPDDFVGVSNFVLIAYLTVAFLVYGDFYLPFVQLDVIHKKEDYSVEQLEAFYDAQQEITERVAPVPVLFGFRVLRLVICLAAIASVFIA